MDLLRRAYRSQSFVFAFANVRWPKRCTLQVSFLRLLDLFRPASVSPGASSSREPGGPFVGKRKRHRLVRFGREIGGNIDLHHLTSLLRFDEEPPVERHGLDEMDRLGSHWSRKHVTDGLPSFL